MYLTQYMMLDFKFKVYDNVLTSKQISSISSALLSSEIPWVFNEKTVTNYEYETQASHLTFEYMQFVHKFKDDDGNVVSNFSGITDYILRKFIEHTNILPKRHFRVKMNLQPKVDIIGHNTPHVDFPKKHWVLLYYVCDSDGDTVIFNNDTIVNTVSPKAGRYLLFDGSQKHAGAHPNISDKRVVVNFN